MTRQPNAVDFWRGFALITIFIDHIPGLIYSRYTLVNVSISDAADLFVFLAGWSIRLMAQGHQMTTRNLMLRLLARALELYAAQVLITMLAIAMLAATAIELSNPLLLEWHNAAAVFNDPVPAHIGLAVLTHQLGYFDILPLYVVLMLMAPLFALIDRTLPNWLLPLSLGFYVIVLAFRLTLPTWPVSGTWFFNPLAWQVLLVLGFVMAKADAGVGAFVRRHIVPIRWIAVPIVILGFCVVRFDWWPDPTDVPNPKLFFIADKTYVTPIRLIQFLALIAVFSLAFRYIKRAAELPFRRLLANRRDRHVRHARPQFALRVLRRLASEPVGADHALLLPRHCRHRHRRGHPWHHHHGAHRMDSRIETTLRHPPNPLRLCRRLSAVRSVGVARGVGAKPAIGVAGVESLSAGLGRVVGPVAAAERRARAGATQSLTHSRFRRRARPRHRAWRRLYRLDRSDVGTRAQGHRRHHRSTAASPANWPPTPPTA